MPMVMMESGPEWLKRHGGNPLHIHTNDSPPFPTGLGLLPDGASFTYRDPDNTRKEPPEDKWKSLELQLTYAKEDLRRANYDYHGLVKMVKEDIEFCQMNIGGMTRLPDPNAPDLLKKLKAICLQKALRVVDLEKELQESPTSKTRQNFEGMIRDKEAKLKEYEERLYEAIEPTRRTRSERNRNV